MVDELNSDESELDDRDDDVGLAKDEFTKEPQFEFMQFDKAGLVENADSLDCVVN